ncbi:MAG TPA: hypothetical protein VM370_07010 [Candidatus Thermoplasmatota archaeon]|nr:hypothetical protein [Candidatus Thermoplasmatota archaeon]
MVLEPIARPRVGQVLNLIGALVALGLTLLSSTVTSVGGVVPFPILAGLVAIGFLIRFGGTTYAIRRGRWGMPWGARIGSWIAWGFGAALLGMAGALLTVAGFGAFLVADALGGFVKREEKLPEVKPVVKRRFPWAALFIFVYLGGVAAFHVFVGRYLPFGILVSWSLLAAGFAMFLYATLRGPKATEAHLLPPQDHRRHERREERVPDPQRLRAQEVLVAFKARGDAGPFLELVREAANAADLKREDVDALETRILHSFARAGTDRDADIRAALDEVERLLALRSQPT